MTIDRRIWYAKTKLWFPDLNNLEILVLISTQIRVDRQSSENKELQLFSIISFDASFSRINLNCVKNFHFSLLLMGNSIKTSSQKGYWPKKKPSDKIGHFFWRALNEANKCLPSTQDCYWVSSIFLCCHFWIQKLLFPSLAPPLQKFPGLFWVRWTFGWLDVCD